MTDPQQQAMPPLPETERARLDTAMKVLSYCPDSGEFRWLATRGAMPAGSIAGSKLGSYIGIRILGRTYLAHRLAFFMMSGEMPASNLVVDHMDGNPLNNRWSNLRLTTDTINNQNVRRPVRGSRSGLLGAHWNEQDQRWQSGIRVNGKTHHLGKFSTAQEAHEAYIAAKRRLHEGCTI